MPNLDANNYRLNPFDVTKFWSLKDYPNLELGLMILNQNP
ncbi:MAG: catalase [Gemmataceae bacterium]